MRERREKKWTKFGNMIIACNYEQKQKGKLSTKRDTDRLSLGEEEN